MKKNFFENLIHVLALCSTAVSSLRITPLLVLKSFTPVLSFVLIVW